MNRQIPSPIISRHRFVGRRDKMAIIKSAVKASGEVRVVCLMGGGGIGKTSVLKANRQNFKEKYIVTEIIDLFDSAANTPQGFMERLIEALPAQHSAVFAGYRKERSRAEAISVSGGKEIEKAWEAAARAFTRCVNSLSENKRLIILIDTVEFATDEFGRWLSEWLGCLKNCVVIMAGRENKIFAEQLPQNNMDVLTTIPIDPFTLDEAKELCTEIGAEAAIHSEELEKLWLLSEGLPILFILAIDQTWPRFVPEGAQHPKEHTRTSGKYTLDELRSLSPEERKETIKDFREELILGVLNLIEMSPTAIALCYMAQVFKFFNAELLSHLEGIGIDSAEEALRRIEPWAFIKYNPSTKSYHLHDLMRELICEIAWPILDIDGGVRQKALHKTVEFYESKLLEINQKKEIYGENAYLYGPRDQSSRTRRAVRDLNSQAALFQSHQVYYKIIESPEEGINLYRALYDYHLWVKDTEAIDHLQKERDNALSAKKSSYPDNWRVFDQAKYLIVIHRDFETAVILLKELGKDGNRKISDDFKAEILLYEGIVYNFRGEYQQAEEKLTRAISLFSDIKKTTFESDPRNEVLARFLSRGYENMGYGHTMSGRLHQASEALKQALPYSWEGKIESERAYQLNGLGYVYACLGEFERGRFLCKEALKLREKMLHEYPVALSNNALGTLEYMADFPGAGRRFSERALRLFTQIGDQKGIGMAHRALGGILARIGARDRSLSDLEIAEQHLLKAIEIFMEGGAAKEPVFMAETYERMGLLYNGFRNIQMLRSVKKADTEDYYRKSRFSFERCIMEYERAGSSLRQAVAIGKLANLYIDSDHIEEAMAEVEKMETLLSGEMDMEPQVPIHHSSDLLENLKQSRRELLHPLGILSYLKGRILWSEFQKTEKSDVFKDCSSQMTTAYVFLSGFSKRVFELDRLINEISEILKSMSKRKRTEFIQNVQEIMNDYPQSDFSEFNHRIEDVNLVLN